MTDNYSIVEYSNEYFDRTARLLRMCEKAPSDLGPHLRWSLLDNPLSSKSLSYLAVCHDEVVGFRGFFPLCFRRDNIAVRVLVPADAFVSPDHRRKRLMTRMTQKAMHELSGEYQYCLSISSNFRTTSGYLRLGWFPLIDKTYQDKPLLRGMLYRLFGAKPRLKKEHELICDPNQIADLYGRIPRCSNVPNENSLLPFIDREYACWRFSNPRCKYFALTTQECGELAAFLVGSLGPYGAVILDYHEQEGVDLFRKTVKRLPRYVCAPLIRFFGFTLTEKQRRIVRSLGYWQYYQMLVDRILRHPRHVSLLLGQVADEIEESRWFQGSRDMRDLSNWCLTGWCSDGP